MAEPGLVVELRQSGPIPLELAFECGAGDTLTVFGPSGSGKTTTLRAIAGLYAPTHALVQAGGETWSDSKRGVWYRHTAATSASCSRTTRSSRI